MKKQNLALFSYLRVAFCLISLFQEHLRSSVIETHNAEWLVDCVEYLTEWVSG